MISGKIVYYNCNKKRKLGYIGVFAAPKAPQNFGKNKYNCIFSVSGGLIARFWPHGVRL